MARKTLSKNQPNVILTPKEGNPVEFGRAIPNACRLCIDQQLTRPGLRALPADERWPLRTRDAVIRRIRGQPRNAVAENENPLKHCDSGGSGNAQSGR